MMNLEFNDREGYYFSITKTRENNLKAKLPSKFSIKMEDGTDIWIKKSDIEFKQLAKGKTKIFINSLLEHTKNLANYRLKLAKLVKKQFIESMLKFYTENKLMLRKIVNFVAEIDFLVSGALVATEYFYCKPVIATKESEVKSYIKVKKLRHPVIERINRETEYIPHDVELGNIQNKNGVLLFGLNSSGKSSMMKSIGLSVILAQIGYYVPATEFIYEPYMALYARITGNDNLFKGLSSFALEMAELNAIIKRTDACGVNTMVIGDEVCRGTESISGVALVASTLIHLSKNNTTFIFASHLHDIPKLDEIKALNNLKVFHLRVEFDEANDCLIFDRQLQPGSGPSVYGLMVAKYLIKDAKFIHQAEVIKKRLLAIDSHNSHGQTLSDIPLKTSKYNSELVVNNCAICFHKPILNTHKELETHHINFQKDCMADGKVKSKPHLDKDSLSNLVVLCRKCHEKVHRKEIIIRGYVDTSLGKMLDYKKDFGVHTIVPKKSHKKLQKRSEVSLI